MIDRFMSLMKGMMNKGMSKLETPEVLAEQAESELDSNLKKVTTALTEGLTSAKMLEKKIETDSKELESWQKRATMAVEQNNDELARQCLQKKQQLSQNVPELQRQLEEQKKTNAALKDNQVELQRKLQDFRAKKNELLARMKAQENVEKANSLVTGSGGATGMDRWEQKISEKEARSQALREMSGNSDFDTQIKELDKKADLDDELLALKATIGSGGSAGPKLIAAKDEQTKAQVDGNLPMVVEVIDPDDKK